MSRSATVYNPNSSASNPNQYNYPSEFSSGTTFEPAPGFQSIPLPYGGGGDQQNICGDITVQAFHINNHSGNSNAGATAMGQISGITIDLNVGDVDQTAVNDVTPPLPDGMYCPLQPYSTYKIDPADGSIGLDKESFQCDGGTTLIWQKVQTISSLEPTPEAPMWTWDQISQKTNLIYDVNGTLMNAAYMQGNDGTTTYLQPKCAIRMP